MRLLLGIILALQPLGEALAAHMSARPSSAPPIFQGRAGAFLGGALERALADPGGMIDLSRGPEPVRLGDLSLPAQGDQIAAVELRTEAGVTPLAEPLPLEAEELRLAAEALEEAKALAHARQEGELDGDRGFGDDSDAPKVGPRMLPAAQVIQTVARSLKALRAARGAGALTQEEALELLGELAKAADGAAGLQTALTASPSDLPALHLGRTDVTLLDKNADPDAEVQGAPPAPSNLPFPDRRTRIWRTLRNGAVAWALANALVAAGAWAFGEAQPPNFSDSPMKELAGNVPLWVAIDFALGAFTTSVGLVWAARRFLPSFRKAPVEPAPAADAAAPRPLAKRLFSPLAPLRLAWRLVRSRNFLARSLVVGIALTALAFLPWAAILGMTPIPLTIGVGIMVVGLLAHAAGEEVFFRGMLLPRLERLFRRLPFGETALGLRLAGATAILLAAAAFAAMHIPFWSFMPTTFLFHFLFGVAMGIIYRRTGSLAAVAMAHGFWNYLVLHLEIDAVRKYLGEPGINLTVWNFALGAAVVMILLGRERLARLAALAAPSGRAQAQASASRLLSRPWTLLALPFSTAAEAWRWFGRSRVAKDAPTP